jgi:hypothetical protein
VRHSQIVGCLTIRCAVNETYLSRSLIIAGQIAAALLLPSPGLLYFVYEGTASPFARRRFTGRPASRRAAKVDNSDRDRDTNTQIRN